jgi:hypothetical protein
VISRVLEGKLQRFPQCWPSHTQQISPKAQPAQGWFCSLASSLASVSLPSGQPNNCFSARLPYLTARMPSLPVPALGAGPVPGTHHLGTPRHVSVRRGRAVLRDTAPEPERDALDHLEPRPGPHLPAAEYVWLAPILDGHGARCGGGDGWAEVSGLHACLRSHP